MEIKHKSKKIQSIFLGYLVAFCIITPLILAAVFLSQVLLEKNKIILPANYVDSKVPQLKESLMDNEKIEEDMVPESCGYGVYSNDGTYLYGNLDKKHIADTWQAVKDQTSQQVMAVHFEKLQRKEDVVILRYRMVMEFSSPVLRRYLPTPAVLSFIVFIAGFIIEIIVLSYLATRKITERMEGLNNTIESIKNRDLEFTSNPCGIKEIDEIQDSIDTMRIELKESLNRQWDMELEKQEQLSALAHDIKTPLTVVRGNVDLMKDTEKSEDQKEYMEYIDDGVTQIQRYLSMLLEVFRSESGKAFNRKEINTEEFIESIVSEVQGALSIKKNTLRVVNENLPGTFNGSEDLLNRAIVNIINNAAEYSPSNNEIDFEIKDEGDFIRFTITDCGSGFTDQDKLQADKLFYRGDQSRCSNDHYGMGLYFARTTAIKHGGELVLDNSTRTKGARVTLTVAKLFNDN